MKNLKVILILLFFASLLITSCETNDDTFIPEENSNTTINYDFGATVSRDFIGQIIDENEDPIQNVMVNIGSSTAQTDVNGIFIIKNASVKSKFAYVTATKAGYLKGSRTVIPTSGENNIKIMLLSATVIGTVTSGTTGNVTLPNGTKVDFDGNFKKEDGSSYSGSVSVILHHLDPSDENVEAKMPGSLLASDNNGQAKVLETFGMINVELQGSGGEKLQLSGSASIELPIDTAQSATSPNTIPLWHFDEEAGYWVEEGTATKVGNKYVGTVSHFSWWNCDAQFPTVNLCLTVVNPNNEPIANVHVELAPNNQTYPRTGISDNNGAICGLIPANQTITMNVLDNCGNVITTSQIGPFSTDTVLPDIILTAGMVQQTTVEGTLAQCNNSNVTDGYVLLHYGNQTLISNVTNGSFDFNTLVCSTNDTFTLEGYDYTNLQTSGVINYTFTTPITTIGNLITCTAVTEYITYQIDNNPVEYLIGSISAGYNPNGLSVSLQGNGTTTGSFYLWGNTNVPGIYTTSTFQLEGGAFNYIGQQTTNTVSFNFTNFGVVGDYIDMTFSGTYEDSNSSTTHTITGVIHVIRDN
ncbi:hypothetical protein FIA58_002350 [Flavobacterium jejuense]|uniref:Carboxypeptidase regulatory-like domain-containing protein n=1 Tax=Flavobacterium jejuense TaxID=1544455 RepID=A0ABX0IN88_9FLAO|nr:hypothetical protein [Flavobacterium jejuense]NHN24505.1 hypothetical protein [Flavobacterium jejuense]